jgi:hypothetical protein
MQRYTASAAALVLLLLGACAGQPEVPDDTLSYATASLDVETVARIHADAVTDPVVTEAAMANADEIVCVTEARTNSYFRTRRCYTRGQLDQQARAAQRSLADATSLTYREIEPSESTP